MTEDMTIIAEEAYSAVLHRFSLFHTAYASFPCIQGYPLYRDNKRFSIYRLNGQINAVYLLDKFLCNDFLR